MFSLERAAREEMERCCFGFRSGELCREPSCEFRGELRRGESGEGFGANDMISATEWRVG